MMEQAYLLFALARVRLYGANCYADHHLYD